MDRYDRAEVCESVGLYILDILTKQFGHNKIGLYRDDKTYKTSLALNLKK